MSATVDLLPPPPPPAFFEAQQQQQLGQTHVIHGSIGPLVAVLFVITFLGVAAGMIGRLCSGRGLFGHGGYDFEGWVEMKCSSCIDGHVDILPTRRILVPVRRTVEEQPEDAGGVPPGRPKEREEDEEVTEDETDQEQQSNKRKQENDLKQHKNPQQQPPGDDSPT